MTDRKRSGTPVPFCTLLFSLRIINKNLDEVGFHALQAELLISTC